MTDQAGTTTSQEGTQHDGHATGMEHPPEMQPPLPLDPPLLPLEVPPSLNPPPMMAISNPPILNEIDQTIASAVPANVMTNSSSSSPKRPWSAMETHGISCDDSDTIPAKKCKTCDSTASIEHYHLEKVNEMLLKNMELKKKISAANELNARLDAIIHQLDTQGPVNKDIVRALLRSEPVEVPVVLDEE